MWIIEQPVWYRDYNIDYIQRLIFNNYHSEIYVIIKYYLNHNKIWP